MGVSSDRKFQRAPVRTGVAFEDCDFYHTIEVPGRGATKGQWDLRGREAGYLGKVDLAGKSVLEIGPASGHLTFWMESQGATVTAFDLSEDHKWDFVPFSTLDMAGQNAARRVHLQRLHNSWWFLREQSKGRAEVVYGTVYDIEPELGAFDVVTLNSVLLHLRDPMGALIKAASVCKETLVITDIDASHYHRRRPWLRHDRSLSFTPRADRPGSFDAWFNIPSGVVTEMLKIMGFETTVTRHKQAFQDGVYRMYTVVGRRTGR